MIAGNKLLERDQAEVCLPGASNLL